MKKIYTHLQRGFTLIEVLVVIAIIGILATFVAIRMNNSQGAARNANAMTTVTSVGKGIETFKTLTSNNQFVSNLPSVTNDPDTLQGNTGNLGDLFTGTNDVNALTYTPALKSTPNNSYSYTYTAPASPNAPGREMLSSGSYIFSTNLINGIAPYFYVTDGVASSGGTNPSMGTMNIAFNPCSSHCISPSDGCVYTISFNPNANVTVSPSPVGLPYRATLNATMPAGNYTLSGSSANGSGPCNYTFTDFATGVHLPEMVTVTANSALSMTITATGKPISPP